MHPHKYGWLEIEKISEYVGHNSLDQTANEISGLIGRMGFVRTVAFIGIAAGYKAKGEPCPFDTAEALVDSFGQFSEAMPYLTAYTDAMTSFFKTDEPVKDTKKKESQ